MLFIGKSQKNLTLEEVYVKIKNNTHNFVNNFRRKEIIMRVSLCVVVVCLVLITSLMGYIAFNSQSFINIMGATCY